MPDRNRGRSEWYRPTYLAAPFKKTARRTGIPNGTKTRAPSTCDSATNGTTALVLQQYTPEWAAAEWLHEAWCSTGQRRAVSLLPRLQVHAVHFLWQPKCHVRQQLDHSPAQADRRSSAV